MDNFLMDKILSILVCLLIFGPIIAVVMKNKKFEKNTVQLAINGENVSFGVLKVCASFLNEDCCVEICVENGKVVFKYKNPLRDIETHIVDNEDLFGVYYKNELEVRSETSALNVVLFGTPGLAMKNDVYINKIYPVFEYRYNGDIKTVITAPGVTITSNMFEMYCERVKNKKIGP